MCSFVELIIHNVSVTVSTVIHFEESLEVLQSFLVSGAVSSLPIFVPLLQFVAIISPVASELEEHNLVQPGSCRTGAYALPSSFDDCVFYNNFLTLTVTSSFQAEFSEINLVANSSGTYTVNLEAIRNGHKVTK